MAFKPQYGTCVSCGEEKLLVIKAGYCHYCNETVRKKKSGKSSLKKTPIKQGNKNAKANMEFYHQVWQYWKQNNMLYCMESGKPLGEFSPSKIAHILSRGAYPKLAYLIENTMPLLFKYHHQLDHGKCDELKIWFWVQEKRQELKRKYYGL